MYLKLKAIILFFFLIANFTLANEINDFEDEFSQYKVNDPLSGYNKVMTRFNVFLYDYALRPTLMAYTKITPKAFRIGVKNFFDNLAFPLRFINNTLQFKFEHAGEESKRFIANTILGFGGIMNAADALHLKKYPADFGSTLAHWGIGSGFHLVLPILGPSNLRDSLSLPVDWFLYPSAYINPDWASFAISAYAYGNEISFRIDEIDEIYHNTPNLYPFLRDAYEQRRIEISK
ncbi:VacJ family lipoprotein [Campylobacter novaezeelandiae]|uniref:VacJ family lipoprotein n=1 Tax=Campylobacter novaezeelandiae TaxID=2267891 RepID=A0A4Q9JSQ9_9BACT|nr:MlaA family lipoprotein [Campylobacter novaezeelandiae]TBR79140.1 VacJ family lipoprotein [Campylobacter novaezeelandiae]